MSQCQAATIIASLRVWNHARYARVAVIAVALAPLGALTIGCRDTEPPPVLYRDLGDADVPLPPPTTSARMNPALRDGRAEWRDFREPQLARMTGAPGAATGVSDAARPSAPASQDDVHIKRIRATLDEFNALVAEGNRDEVPDYFVEAQADRMEFLVKRESEMWQTLSEIRRALEARLPDETERIAKAFEPLEQLARGPMLIDDIALEGDDRASGVLRDMPDEMRVQFEQEEGVWYFRFPDAFLEQSLAMIEGALPGLKQLKTALESSDAPVEQILAAIEQSTQAMMNAMGGAAPTEGG